MRFTIRTAISLISALIIGCAKHPTTGVSVDSRLISAIPPTTEVVGQLAVSKFETSGFYVRHRHELDIPMLNAAAERLGFDPRRDLSTVFFASDSRKYLFLAEGRWESKVLAKNLAAFGGRQTTYRGIAVVDNGAESAAFFPDKMAAIGPSGAVRASIDQNAQPNSRASQGFESILAALPPSAQLWLASRNGLPFTNLITRSDISSALANITPDIAQAGAAVTFDSGAHIEIALFCYPGASQLRVYEGLRAGLAFGRLTSQRSDPQLAQLYSALRVEQEGQTIHVRADLTSAQTDELLATALKLRLR